MRIEMATQQRAGAVPAGVHQHLQGSGAFDRPPEAVFMPVHRYGLPGRWERTHARLAVPIRLGSGVWLIFLTVILYRSGRDKRWGLLLMPAAALHFYLAYRLSRPAQD